MGLPAWGIRPPVDGRNDKIKSAWLVLGCQQGDPAAFEQLVALWQAPLWRYVRRMVDDETATWDVLQETWIAVARSIHRLQEAAAFPAWLYRIASNKAQDWIRRESRRRQVLRDYTDELSRAEASAAPPRRGDGGLAATLEGLPKEVQLILQLRYEQDFSTRDIAEILSIPEGTVRSRLHHARLRLRQRLEEGGDER